MKLLIVDDDIPTVEVIRDSIAWQAMGIREVFTAHNITKAKEILGEYSVDIALCDIEMPMGSGLDLLEWARGCGMGGEFIFLTNHESFEFASTAIQHQALGYVLKPFNADRITREVMKAVEKIRQERQLEEYSAYGSYWLENKPVVEQRFWRDMLFAVIAPNREIIEGELQKRNIALGYDDQVRLIMLSVFWREDTRQAWGEANRGILEYSMMKACAELLLDEMTMEHVVSYGMDEMIYVVCVAGYRCEEEALRQSCGRLLALCRESLDCEGTCYIGGPVALEGLSRAREELEERDRDNIQRRGQVLVGEAVTSRTGQGWLEDFPELQQLLMRGEKIKILTTIRTQMESLAQARKLDAAAMHAIQQNIIQAVYVYLHNKGIQPDALFSDKSSLYLMSNGVKSLYDMIKWQSYFISKAVDYDRELQKGRPVIEQAEQFVRAHYMEEISRNEVAEHVYLTPEYFAKLFKKETGLSIKEYINRYRVEQAKELLENTELQISDIAGRVGFDNLSYFSTLFKKLTGHPPNEYKLISRQGRGLAPRQ